MRAALFLLALAVTSCNRSSGEPQLAVSDAWARETVPGQTVGAAYLTVRNDGEGDDRLVAATSPAAATITIHSTTVENGVARMRRAESIPIPAGESVKLAPGGTHIMLTGLREPLRSGEPLRLTLRFQRSGEVPVTATVG